MKKGIIIVLTSLLRILASIILTLNYRTMNHQIPTIGMSERLRSVFQELPLKWVSNSVFDAQNLQIVLSVGDGMNLTPVR